MKQNLLSAFLFFTLISGIAGFAVGMAYAAFSLWACDGL